jgi:hypothetical protein
MNSHSPSQIITNIQSDFEPLNSYYGRVFTHSDLYMWESTDNLEFESDLIASTNEMLYSEK